MEVGVKTLKVQNVHCVGDILKATVVLDYSKNPGVNNGKIDIP